MPIPKSFASALVLAGALTCGAPSNPSDAAERVRPGNPWQQAFDVDEEPLTRDLRPMPAKPSHTAPHPRVTLRPSSPVVTVGEPISFEVGSNMNGFGHIYVLSASGRVQVWMENVPVAAGQRLQFPTGRVWIRAAAPAGREDLMLIVTKNRIEGFCGHETTHAPRLLDYDHHDFKQALTAKFMDRPQREWGYARAVVRVVDRSSSAPTWDWGSSDLWASPWE